MKMCLVQYFVSVVLSPVKKLEMGFPWSSVSMLPRISFCIKILPSDSTNDLEKSQLCPTVILICVEACMYKPFPLEKVLQLFQIKSSRTSYPSTCTGK